MKNIKINILILSVFAFFFMSCSGLFNLTEEPKTDENNFSITLNNSSATRTISPFYIQEKLSLVSDWTVKFLDESGNVVNQYTTSASDGTISLKLNFSGTYTVEVSGTFTTENGTYEVYGKNSNVKIAAGASAEVSVNILKTGSGTFSYRLYFDDSWNETLSEAFSSLFESYGEPPATEEGSETEVLGPNQISCSVFDAKLQNIFEEDDTHNLTCECYFTEWTYTKDGESTSGGLFNYLSIYSEAIDSGTYNLIITMADGTEVPLTDSIVEIYNGENTYGSGTTYNQNYYAGFISPYTYYVTNSSDGQNYLYNGKSPASRVNFTQLINRLKANPPSNEVLLHFSESEDISDYAGWNIWNSWHQEFNFYALSGDYPASEQKFNGSQFYGFETPLFVWNGKTTSSPSTYNSFKVTNKMSQGELNSLISDSLENVIDSTFDANGNLYVVVTGDNGCEAKKYPYNSDSRHYGTAESLGTSSSTIYLYTDIDNNIVYMDNGNGDVANTIIAYNASNGNCTTYTGSVYAVNPYAVYNGKVYHADTTGISIAANLLPAGTVITEAVTISGVEYSAGAVLTNPVTQSTGGSPRIDILGNGTKFGFSTIDDTSKIKITDLQVIGNYMYALICNVADYFYSRGCVLKLAINADGTLSTTDYETLGWYSTNTAATCSSGDSAVEFLRNYFTGPVKFAAVMPKKLIIADDGAYYEGDTSLKDVNRFVTVDLEKFAMESYVDVDATFDKTADWKSNYENSSFNYIKFNDAE